jgi:hypothetical protein
MGDEMRVLGIASRFADDRLRAHFVLAALRPSVSVTRLAPWQGTRRTDLPSQLADLHQVIRNRADPIDPLAIAVKRAESPPRRPPHHYDCRVSLEAVAMLVAEELGLQHFGYRRQDLKRLLGSQDPLGLAREVGGLEADEPAEAAAAACAAMRELLGHELEL